MHRILSGDKLKKFIKKARRLFLIRKELIIRTKALTENVPCVNLSFKTRGFSKFYFYNNSDFIGAFTVGEAEELLSYSNLFLKAWFIAFVLNTV